MSSARLNAVKATVWAPMLLTCVAISEKEMQKLQLKLVLMAVNNWDSTKSVMKQKKWNITVVEVICLLVLKISLIVVLGFFHGITWHNINWWCTIYLIWKWFSNAVYVCTYWNNIKPEATVKRFSNTRGIAKEYREWIWCYTCLLMP